MVLLRRSRSLSAHRAPLLIRRVDEDSPAPSLMYRGKCARRPGATYVRASKTGQQPEPPLARRAYCQRAKDLHKVVMIAVRCDDLDRATMNSSEASLNCLR